MQTMLVDFDLTMRIIEHVCCFGFMGNGPCMEVYSLYSTALSTKESTMVSA